MRDHVLLQAIARDNRPFERDPGTKKPCGLVIDFIGLFEKLEKALAFDSDTVASVIENIDVLKSRFEYLMKSKSKSYLDLVEGRKGDKLVEHILDFFGTKGRRDGFVDYFREIEGLYEIISPDQFLRATQPAFVPTVPGYVPGAGLPSMGQAKIYVDIANLGYRYEVTPDDQLPAPDAVAAILADATGAPARFGATDKSRHARLSGDGLFDPQRGRATLIANALA